MDRTLKIYRWAGADLQSLGFTDHKSLSQALETREHQGTSGNIREHQGTSGNNGAFSNPFSTKTSKTLRQLAARSVPMWGQAWRYDAVGGEIGTLMRWDASAKRCQQGAVSGQPKKLNISCDHCDSDCDSVLTPTSSAKRLSQFALASPFDQRCIQCWASSTLISILKGLGADTVMQVRPWGRSVLPILATIWSTPTDKDSSVQTSSVRCTMTIKPLFYIHSS